MHTGSYLLFLRSSSSRPSFFIFSAKDLCTLEFISELKKSGAVCFKIEGRNKEPEYVSVVTKVYREAIDNKLTKQRINELMNELKKVYN